MSIKKTIQIIRIQPETRASGVLPYPYFINEEGGVQNQSFWNGEPSLLIGFALPRQQVIEFTFSEFWKKPSRAIGLFPVFKHADDTWHTYADRIESVTVTLK